MLAKRLGHPTAGPLYVVIFGRNAMAGLQPAALAGCI
jgi:hypothetical protein